MTGRRTADAALLPSIAGGLYHRSPSAGRPVERAVHLLERAALGFGAEHPEADHAEGFARKTEAIAAEVPRLRGEDHP